MATVNLTTYDIGDQVLIQAVFAVSGTATNPTTVTATIKAPDATITSHVGTIGGLTNPTTGTWQWLEAPSQTGTYAYSFTGTGAAAAYEEGRFYVRAKQVA